MPDVIGDLRLHGGRPRWFAHLPLVDAGCGLWGLQQRRRRVLTGTRPSRLSSARSSAIWRHARRCGPSCACDRLLIGAKSLAISRMGVVRGPTERSGKRQNPPQSSSRRGRSALRRVNRRPPPADRFCHYSAEELSSCNRCLDGRADQPERLQTRRPRLSPPGSRDGEELN